MTFAPLPKPLRGQLENTVKSARFLVENSLLLWEPGAPVALDDCRDLVDHHPDLAMGARTHWELAGKLAARMLPQVFKPRNPVFELALAPEHQRELERLLAGLPPEVFTASDSLGGSTSSGRPSAKTKSTPRK